MWLRGGSTGPSRSARSAAPAFDSLKTGSTVTVGDETGAIAKWDAIPVRVGETSHFTNNGTEPLELFVMGVAADMDAKTRLVTGGAR